MAQDRTKKIDERMPEIVEHGGSFYEVSELLSAIDELEAEIRLKDIRLKQLVAEMNLRNFQGST